MGQKCINCEKEISDESFCPHCSVSQHCLKCHTNFTGNEKFCGKCGEARQNISPKNKGKSVKVSDPVVNKTADRPSERQTGLRKIPPIFWAIGLVVVFIVSYIIISGGSDEKAIERTVMNYVAAMENHDIESIYKLTHPDVNLSRSEISSELEYLPTDVEINIDHFFGWEIFDTRASVQAVIILKSEFHNVREKDEVVFELTKEGKKWLVNDTY